jgi:predicted pyridoxine 5'-phosphate oxidase superfamily flavin-nucleotide-binding protein
MAEPVDDLRPGRATPLDPPPHAADAVFTPAVRAAQARKGSAAGYADWAPAGDITPDLRAFIESRDSAYLATASAQGQPYVQHRGGPPGFLRVLDPRTIAFADFRGNRQYITTGNLSENPHAFLFLMDYARRRRIKIWGAARVSGDPAVTATLMPVGYRARPEQAIILTVTAWDANCAQHIPQKIAVADVAAALAERDARIAALEAELVRLRG